MLAKAREEMLLIEEVENELVVYDERCHRAHRLNPISATVFRHLDGEHTVEELVEVLRDAGNADADSDLVWTVLNELEQVELLASRTGRSAEEGRVSRRRVMRKLGVASVTFLFVSTILAPQPAEAASPVVPDV